jgi:hypothetical protein
MCTGLEVALISGGTAAFSAVTQAQTAAAQMEHQAKINEYNAGLARNKAIAARQTAAAREAQVRKAGRRALSNMSAGYGAAGVTTAGTPLLVMSETVGEIELDALRLQRQGNQEAINALAEQSLEKWQAASMRSMASHTRKMGFVSAGTSLLGSYAGYKYGQTQTTDNPLQKFYPQTSYS